MAKHTATTLSLIGLQAIFFIKDKMVLNCYDQKNKRVQSHLA